MLYENPETTAKVLSQLDPGIRLVPIYKQADWIKVGNPNNGQVGWINKKQYQTANATAQKAKMEMYFVQLNNDQGKSEIIAYKNGEKLSAADAKKLYDQLSVRQAAWNQRMRTFHAHMNRMFMENMAMFNDDFRWMDEMAQPIVIVDRKK